MISWLVVAETSRPLVCALVYQVRHFLIVIYKYHWKSAMARLVVAETSKSPNLSCETNVWRHTLSIVYECLLLNTL